MAYTEPTRISTAITSGMNMRRSINLWHFVWTSWATRRKPCSDFGDVIRKLSMCFISLELDQIVDFLNYFILFKTNYKYMHEYMYEMAANSGQGN